jgi:diphthamide synthase (EF-2-diphthine--ammonia ligase)
MRKKTWLSWSSGKDSAWALHVLLQSGEYEVTGLFTTVNAIEQFPKNIASLE